MAKGLKLLIAVILGALAAVTALAYLAGRESQLMQSQELKQVFVAVEDIRRGTTIDKAMITTRSVPEAYVQPGAISKAEDVIGRISRTEILQHEQILETKLSTINSETLAQLIIADADARAVTLPISAITGVAGLIKPGDHVDVLGFFETAQEGQRNTELRLLQPNCLILAVDQNMQPGGGVEKGGSSGGAGASLVTLYVKAQVAQKLLLAQRVGEIALLLRHTGDSSEVSLPIWDTRMLLGDRQVWRESSEAPGMFPPSSGGVPYPKGK